MTSASSCPEFDLVVAEDGSIPAEQVAALGVRPGSRLRVVREPGDTPGTSIAGRLTTWPDVTWEDFERASSVAQADVSRP